MISDISVYCNREGIALRVYVEGSFVSWLENRKQINRKMTGTIQPLPFLHQDLLLVTCVFELGPTL